MRLTYPIKRGRSMLNQRECFCFHFYDHQNISHCTTKDKDNCYYLNNNKRNKKTDDDHLEININSSSMEIF